MMIEKLRNNYKIDYLSCDRILIDIQLILIIKVKYIFIKRSKKKILKNIYKLYSKKEQKNLALN